MSYRTVLWRRLVGGATVLGALCGGALLADEPRRTEAITDPAAIRAIPFEQRQVAVPVNLEGRVSFVDPGWRHLWLERGGRGQFLALSINPPALHQGQRVRLHGEMVPDKGLDAAEVQVEVLKDFEAAEPIEATSRIFDRDAWLDRVVTVQAYVDSQRTIDATHVWLALIVEGQSVVGWVWSTNPSQVPDWRGKFIRFTGLYQARFDPSGTQIGIELRTSRLEEVVALGSLAESGRFDGPVTPIDQIFRAAPGRELKIRGRVQASQSGSSLEVRDATGQVLVRSMMQQPLEMGREVEVVGTPTVVEGRWTLGRAFFRPVESAPIAAPRNLATVEQIRRLKTAEAAQGLPVDIAGVVTWSKRGTDIFYLEDLTGGIRVHYDLARMNNPQRNKHLRIRGVTRAGGFAPTVELQQVEDLGVLETPRPRKISYDRAATGVDDGQLVEMRGFFERVETDPQGHRIHVMTPEGEIIGLMNVPVSFAPPAGSLVRLQGICEVVADRRGSPDGVRLLLSSMESAVVETKTPADAFAVPLREIAELRQLAGREKLQRVRVAGVVLHVEPDRSVYLADEGVAVRVHTRDTAFVPGDQIEAVGILGHEGVRMDLRAASCRKMSGGPPPAPVRLDDPAKLMPELDLQLVRLSGTLVDVTARGGQTRFTLQAKERFFEAILADPANGLASAATQVGAELEMTGLYRIDFDDARQTRDFQLQLRSPADVVVIKTARIWTLARALTVAAVLGGLTLAGFAWVVALRRRVHQQTTQIRLQLERQSRLEGELQRAARLESLGVLAGGIAHDFNNLLTVMLGRLGLVLADDALSPDASAHLHEIARAAGRARHLTRQLLTFAKGGDPLLESVSLADAVKTAFDAVLKTAALPSPLSVQTEISVTAELWRVAADKDQLAQVLQNLALNALQAMPRGGTLRARLSNVTIGVDSRHGLAPGRYVRLALSDTGEGIPPAVLPKIFDPYFSTRPGGRGLGLATAYSIVAKHQGRIVAESMVGHGTTFHIWLPAPEGRIGGSEAPFESVPSPAATAAPAAGGAPRVLLMDDEESIREVGAIVLRRAGFDVVAVTDGETALREFASAQRSGRNFNLVILDLTIPGGMGGREAIERIRQLDPTVCAIVSSGYSNDPVMANFANYGFQGMVPKPYEINVLMAAVEKVLGRLPPPPPRR